MKLPFLLKFSKTGQGLSESSKLIVSHISEVISFGKAVYLFLYIALSLVMRPFDAAALQAPLQLRTDLLEHTDRVFLDGYPTTVRLDELSSVIERYQVALIKNDRPFYSWIVSDSRPNTLQKAYRILVSRDPGFAGGETGDVWDSGYMESDNSTAVRHSGKPLEGNTVYYWKVKTWNNYGEESPFSAIKGFLTANTLDGSTARYPLQKKDEMPVSIRPVVPGKCIYVDFGKASFGRLKLTLFSQDGGDTITVHLGEYAQKGRVVREMGLSSVRYAQYRLPLLPGKHTYVVKIRPDKRNTRKKETVSGVGPILMPEYTGEVLPFRYCELEDYTYPVKETDLVRETVHYPFNDNASFFHSSDTILNALWELSKYSIKGTSYTGVYVDGDRERIPYENEALTNQLCHYTVDDGYSIARYSHEYLIKHPTWPTEWHLKSIQMAWHDYMYTGNPASIQAFYTDLKAKTLIALKESNGLISTRTGKQTPEFLKSLNFNGKELRDIVDWPHTGILGLDKNEFGETDGFVFTDYNTVVNALHFDALSKMSEIAGAAGFAEDQLFFKHSAEKVKERINELLFDKNKKRYVDGIGTTHSSLHANIYPLAFGIVPEEYVSDVVNFIRTRGMACNLSAPILVESVYHAHDAAYGLWLLSKADERSWYNAIRIGSTMTIEAWDNKYKPNLDWNHAEGAAPAYLIARNLMGIQPLEPGFKKISIRLQPSELKHAEICTPTIRGTIKVTFTQTREHLQVHVVIPSNAVAEVHLPLSFDKYRLFINGKVHDGIPEGGFVRIDHIGSGSHQFILKKE